MGMLDPLLPNEHDEAIGDVFDVSTCVSFRTGMSKGALVIGLTIFFQGAQQEKSQAAKIGKQGAHLSGIWGVAVTVQRFRFRSESSRNHGLHLLGAKPAEQ